MIFEGAFGSAEGEAFGDLWDGMMVSVFRRAARANLGGSPFTRRGRSARVLPRRWGGAGTRIARISECFDSRAAFLDRVQLNSTGSRFVGILRAVKQTIVTLDLEGVLVPEIWIAVAEKTGIPELRLTTRDIPDYDVLMRGRLKILAEHSLGIRDIQETIGTLKPLEGAKEFLDELRSLTQVMILSDTFEEFAQPLMRQLGWPTLLCHRLVIEEGKVSGYKLRVAEQKREAVKALRALNYQVISAGDSFNDTAMLAAADAGYLFHAPKAIQEQFPQFEALEDYGTLLERIRSHL